MITWIRSAAIAPGKVGDAFSFVRKAANIIRDKHNITISVGRPIAGNPTRIFWSSQHASLQEYERDHQKINSDTEFMQMLTEGGPCR